MAEFSNSDKDFLLSKRESTYFLVIYRKTANTWLRALLHNIHKI